MENYKRPAWLRGNDGWFYQTPSPSVLERLREEKSFKGGNKMEHKIFHAEIKEFDDANLIVTHFISTERRDRGGDVMRAAGMKIGGKVVVLLAHGFSNLGQEPIAKPLKIWSETFKGSPGICARTQFYDGSRLTPPDNTGRRLYEKARNGYMPNWSIGWLPLKWEDSHGPHGEMYRDVSEWELLEYSPVGVPMNPDCQNIEKCGGLCQKEAWFKVLPNVSDIFTKSFDHYRPAPPPPKLEDIKCHLGKNQFCTLKELPQRLEEMNRNLIRKEIRKAQGRVD
jgi:hypothetical protein